MSLTYVGEFCGVCIWSDSAMLNDEPPRLWRSQQSARDGRYDVSVSKGGARELFARFYPKRAQLSTADFVAHLSKMRSPFDYGPTPEQIDQYRREQARVDEIAQRRERTVDEARASETRAREWVQLQLRDIAAENERLRHMIGLQRDELERLQQQDRTPEPEPEPPDEPSGRKIVL